MRLIRILDAFAHMLSAMAQARLKWEAAMRASVFSVCWARGAAVAQPGLKTDRQVAGSTPAVSTVLVFVLTLGGLRSYDHTRKARCSNNGVAS